MSHIRCPDDEGARVRIADTLVTDHPRLCHVPQVRNRRKTRPLVVQGRNTSLIVDFKRLVI